VNRLFIQIRTVLLLNSTLRCLQVRGKMYWGLFWYILSSRKKFMRYYISLFEQLSIKNSLNNVVLNFIFSCILRYVFEKQEELRDEALSFEEKKVLLKSDYLLAKLFIAASKEKYQSLLLSKFRAMKDYIEEKSANIERDALYIFDEECIKHLAILKQQLQVSYE
jgi:hypothetical protein